MKSKILTLLCFILINQAQSQTFYANIGGQLATIREEGLYAEKKPFIGFHLGAGLEYSFNTDKKLSVFGELNYLPKGYSFKADETKYSIKFNYFNIQAGLNFAPVAFIGLSGGLEANLLLGARQYNFESKNSNEVTENYKAADYSVFGKIYFFNNQIISPYIAYSHSFRPILHYIKFDEIGNEIGQIKDVKNYAFLVGLKIKFLK